MERLTLSVEVDTPAQVTPIEEIALFRYDVAERPITMVNEGSSMAEIIDIEAPEGYEVVGSTISKKLGSKESMTFKVKRLWHIEAAPESIMRIRSTSDTKSVTLYTATTEIIRSRPFAIMRALFTSKSTVLNISI